MSLTPTQETRLRRDFGEGTTQVFTTAELEDIWTRVAAATSEEQQHRAALAIMFEQTLNSAVKLHDYEAGQTSHKLSQVYNHLKDRAAYYAPYLQEVLNQRVELVVRPLRPRARPNREKPYDA